MLTKILFSKGKFYFLSSLLERITSLLFFIILAKIFSVSEYGQIVTVFTVSNIILIFFNLGLPKYLQREAALNENYSDTFSTLILLKILFIIPFYIIVFVYFIFDATSINLWIILIISLSAFFIDVINILSHHFFGKDEFKVTFFAVAIARFSLVLILLIFWQFDLSLIYFVSIYLFTALIQISVLVFYLVQQKMFLIINKQFFSAAKNIFIISFPIGLGYLFNFVYDRIDILLISNYLGDSAVAQYNVAYSFYRLSGLFFGMILIPSFNLLSQKSKDFNILYQNFIVIGKTVLLFASLLFIIYYLIGPIIIDFIFNDKYNQAEQILPLLSFAIVGLGLNNLTGVYLNSLSYFKLGMYSAAIAVVANIVFNIVFLSKLGIVAAAYSTIIAEYTIFIIQCLFIYQIHRHQK